MLPENLLPHLPDHARVWIYAADRVLSPSETQEALTALGNFVNAWASHGRKVHGGVSLLEGRFVVIGAVLDEGEISGCGIDASTGVLRALSANLKVEWLPNLNVFYRDACGSIQAVTRKGFKELARQGQVSPETHVFDVSVGILGEIRHGHFERRAADSWHNQLLASGTPAVSNAL